MRTEVNASASAYQDIHMYQYEQNSMHSTMQHHVVDNLSI